MHIEDLALYFRLVHSRGFIDVLETEISQQIKVIKASSARGFEKRMWSIEARRSFRYAFFLRYYASFETHLKAICDRFAETDMLELRLSDISGDNILKRANKYLTRVVGCNAIDRHPLWEHVLAYMWVRNTIVHNDGFVSDLGSIPQFVKRQLTQPSSGLTLRWNRINMRRRFCYRAIRNMAQFLVDIYDRKQKRSASGS